MSELQPKTDEISKRIYYVFEGTGSFNFGETTAKVTAGDLFVIPPDSDYEYSGDMKLLEVNIDTDKDSSL